MDDPDISAQRRARNNGSGRFHASLTAILVLGEDADDRGQGQDPKIPALTK
jgi:hypothetical protein